MPFSAESQVLQRHLDQFQNKDLLFAGQIFDDFPQSLTTAKHCRVWSWYFDYARHYSNSEVIFSPTCHEKAELMLYYWTKNKRENQFQLLQWLSHAPLHQQILIVGENRTGVKSVEKMLSPFGTVAKIDSARRCSLYYFELTHKPDFDETLYWQQHTFANHLQIMTLPGVFSADELDKGTALLLETLNNRPFFGEVLDLGCGAGVIGCAVKQKHPHIQLTMTDIHAMALASAVRSLEINGLKGEVVASDVFSALKGKQFDFILSNPPFHSGVDTAYRAVTELITQAKWHLKPKGELRLVANRHLPYPDLLDAHFGQHQVLAQTHQFCVYSVMN